MQGIVKELSGLIEHCDISMFGAATWYKIEYWFKLSRQIEQVIYELANDFRDV